MPFLEDDDFWSAIYAPSPALTATRTETRPKPWSTFAAEFFEVCRVEDCARSTIAKHRQVSAEVGALAGVRSTADLTPAVVGRYKASKAACSPVTVAGLLSYLRRQASYAEACGYLERSPFRVLSRRVMPRAKGPAKQIHHLPGAIARVLALLAPRIADWDAHRIYALIATGAFTGARKSELLHAHAADVDLTARTFSISDRRRLKRPSAARVLAVPDALAEILAAWIPRAHSPWLFPCLNRANPWTGGSPGRKPLDRLKAIGREAGVADFTFRSLRHSWTTIAAEYWQLGELVVQDVLGHTSPKTQRGYRHRDPALLYQAVRAIRFDEEARA